LYSRAVSAESSANLHRRRARLSQLDG